MSGATDALQRRTALATAAIAVVLGFFVGAYGAYGPWIADASVVQGAAVVALTVLAGVGAARCWSRASVSVLVFVPYGLLLMLWPYPPDRFLWPLWLSGLVLLSVGVAHLDAPTPRPAARLAVRAVAVLLAAGFCSWYARSWRDRSWESIERANARIGLAAASVAAALPPTDSWRRIETRWSAQLAGVLDAYHPRWVVVGERESLRAAVQLARSGRLKLKGADPSNVLVV